VSSLTSTDHRLNPNPLSLHPHATFFSGSPAEPPPPKPIVVGAEATIVAAEPEPIQRAIVVGHTGEKLLRIFHGLINYNYTKAFVTLKEETKR
jgi:hypothetical protein